MDLHRQARSVRVWTINAGNTRKDEAVATHRPQVASVPGSAPGNRS
jgi:hypothetical protein